MSVTTMGNLPAMQDPPIMVGPGHLTVWALTVVYGCDMGVRQVPVCGKSQTQSDFNRVHGGRAGKSILWVAQQWGTQVPPLPAPDTQSSNEILLSWAIGMPVPGKTPDGYDIVMVSGEYHFGLRMWPNLATDILTGACAPYQSTPSVTVYQLSQDDFHNRFVGPSVKPQGFSGGVLSLP
jgi:hypothetical protein